ncbi:MAG: hypothetical protein LBR95_10205 [Azoarcus sp.]|nr:hypothetical protein [Azoarcus sp.]
MKRFLSIAALLFLAFTLTQPVHAARSVPLPKFENEVILEAGAPGGAAKVHDAILVGAAQMNWTVVSDANDTVRLGLTVRNKHAVEVDVRIHENSVSVDYVSSINLRYRDGAIHPNYGNWIKRLLDAARKAAHL